MKTCALASKSPCISPIVEDGEHWILCNASPDIRAQLDAFDAMQPARAVRDTGISAVLLCDSQFDHTTSLLMLHEGMPLDGVEQNSGARRSEQRLPSLSTC